jgi:hypothetical protein
MIMRMIYTRRYEKEEDIKDAYIKSSKLLKKEKKEKRRGEGWRPYLYFYPSNQSGVVTSGV